MRSTAFVAILVPLAGCAPPASLQRAIVPHVTTARSIVHPRHVRQLAILQRVTDLVHEGRNAEAERIVDEEITNPELEVDMTLFKARLLARRGAKGPALDAYLRVIRDPKRRWVYDASALREPLDLAVALGRAGDADEIAGRMVALRGGHPDYDTEASVPRSADTPRERLAYAYLVAAQYLDAIDYEGKVAYRERAHALLPHSVPVLAQLGEAYADRRKPGDLARAFPLYQEAYARARDPRARERIQLGALGQNVGEVSKDHPHHALIEAGPYTREAPIRTGPSNGG